jgi:methyltransferase (TIGR00027 family)
VEERRIERKGSTTSGYTCFSRACATREQDERLRGPDYLAEIFLPPIPQILLRVACLRELCMHKMFPPGIHEYVLARTRVLDEVYVHSLERGFAQIVLLGAGMDTRPLRFQDENRGTRVFELDIEATQRYKTKVYTRKGVPLPEELVFATIDFNKESVASVLSNAGYRANQKTLFLWEGVTMYLEPQAVDSTLAFIHDSAGEGSILAFDFVRAPVLRGKEGFYGGDQAAVTVARTGEAWRFGIEDGAIEAFLAERGFRLLEHHTPADLEAAYLTGEDGSRLGRVNETHCIVVAGLDQR